MAFPKPSVPTLERRWAEGAFEHHQQNPSRVAGRLEFDLALLREASPPHAPVSTGFFRRCDSWLAES